MTLSILFLLLPALYAYVLLERAEVFTSTLARAFSAWFVGECTAGFAVYGLATLLAPWTDGVLRKASRIVLVVCAAALAAALFERRARAIARPVPSSPPRRPIAMAGTAVYLAACALFALAFYHPHLLQTREAIFRSPIYWDFNVHAPIVQNFAFGDNFPAGNDSFAGAPETYHFFFDLLTAVPVSFGVDLAPAFLLVGATTLFALLGLLAGFAKEMSGGAGAGMLAAPLACTSSSLRFVDSFRRAPTLFSPFREALYGHPHPYAASFVEGNPFAYNGSMFNLFYFLEERQLVFAAGFLLAAVLLLSTRRRWTTSVCVAAGGFFGLFAFWHLFVTISLGLAVVWLFAFAPDRRKTAMTLAAMGLVGLGFLAWVWGAARPDWFLPGARAGARLNPAFSTMPGGPPFSLMHALGYWLYAWGLKAILGGAGLLLAFRTRRPLFHALASILVPTFLLVNAVQLVPLSIYDNHKWLRPMTLSLDLAAAFFLVERAIRAKGSVLARTVVAAAAILLMTLSGTLESIPFLRSRATVLYAVYPSDLTRDVREKTAPRSVFASFEANAIHLAGRKVFVGNDADERGTASLLASAGFDVSGRQRVLLDLYRLYGLHGAGRRGVFCDLARANAVDWLEIEPEGNRGSETDPSSPGFETIAPSGRRIRFLDVKRFCGGSPN